MRSRRQVIPAPHSDKLMNTSACEHVMHHAASLQSTFAGRVAVSTNGPIQPGKLLRRDHLCGGPAFNYRSPIAEPIENRLTTRRQLVNHPVGAAGEIALQQAVGNELAMNL